MRYVRGMRWLLVLLVACHRDVKSAPDTGTDAAPIAPAPVPAKTEEVVDRPEAGEAVRTTVRVESEPLLRPHLAAIRARFGEAPPPLAMQRAPLAGGRSGILLETPDEKTGLVLVLDGAALAWSKERPTAGMTPPARELAIAAHPSGGAVLFAYDEPARRVAMRIWSDDGAPFADLELMELEVCAALDAAYWPGRGWLVVAASATGPIATLVREDGGRAWPTPIELGVPSRGLSPISVVIDTPSSAVLVQRVPGKNGAPDQAVATRYDPRGRMLWDKAAVLGDARGSAKARLAATRLRDGVVKVELARPLEIHSDGVVVLR
jgi:hypothetical protein